jgi:hypothetical protein
MPGTKVRDGRELDETNKSSDAKDRAGSERPLPHYHFIGAAGSANLTPRSWFTLRVAGRSKSAIRISFVQEPLVQ